jgi:flagellar FliL protein
MAGNKMEAPARGGREAAKDAGEGEAAEAAAAPKASGGLKPWLPLIVAVVSMPLLAFVTTRFVLLPKIQHALGQPKTAASEAATEPAAASGGEAAKGAAGGKVKIMVPMSKMLVNVAGTMGTRYLMTSVTLVGTAPDFKTRIEDNKDQLTDLATGALSSKTISDLEKPGARNQIRAELMTVLNNALGGPLVQEIYITELAIQ